MLGPVGIIHKTQELPIKVFQKHSSPGWNMEKCMLLLQTRKQNNSILWVIEQAITAEKCPPIAKPLKYLEKVKVMTSTRADQVPYAAAPRNNAATYNVINRIERDIL